MGAGSSAAEARFTQLYARFYSPIRAYCNRRVLSEAGDDAVAEVFLTMWRRFDEVPEGDAALVWLYGVAYRVIGHQWRSCHAPQPSPVTTANRRVTACRGRRRQRTSTMSTRGACSLRSLDSTKPTPRCCASTPGSSCRR